ncbi:hypothetical protein CPS_0772 [Colwellia psychrerythraea 34H]|uniref:Uncharacterized protein n=1 Tax=Colwellia psychrerythraea (strain 34H / ATCC BAA-681) TaxID=167879 RepID=Q488J3_COLP3|nr:hypothetical protein CPS_0772 [Colwellia psychrerythraea 34H]
MTESNYFSLLLNYNKFHSKYFIMDLYVKFALYSLPTHSKRHMSYLPYVWWFNETRNRE